MRMFSGRPSSGMIVGAVGLLAGIGGIALAAIPDSSGVISGCYQKHNGNLRVVDSAGDCRNSETAIQWNQRGPAGPQGQHGAQGPAGAVDVYTKIENFEQPPGSGTGSLEAGVSCDQGDIALGGGYRVSLPFLTESGAGTWRVRASEPSENPRSWIFALEYEGLQTTFGFTLTARCLDVGGDHAESGGR